MQFGEKAGPHKPPFPLAAMVDIMFLLLLFFMLTSLYAEMEAELNITLPKSEEASAIERAVQDIIVNVKADGTYVINQIAYDAPQVDEILRALAKQYQGDHIIIRGDMEAKYDSIIQLLSLCTKYNIWNINFAVRKEAPAEAEAAGTP